MRDIKNLEHDLNKAFSSKGLVLDEYLDANAFAKKINYYMANLEKKKISQAALHRRTGLSKGAICSLISYRSPSDEFIIHKADTILRLVCALHLTPAQHLELDYLNAPHIIIFNEAKKLGYSAYDINDFLYCKGLPIF